MPPTLINLNATVPAAPAGDQNVGWQKDASNPRNVSAFMTPFIGDTGSGGTSGGVPAPPAGAAAAGAFLKADGTWKTPGVATPGWAPFTSMMAPATVTPPVLSAMNLGNPGGSGAIALNAGGALYMSKQGAGGNDLFQAYKIAPTPPWTFTIGYVPGPGVDASMTNLPGIAMRQSATGKIVFFTIGQSGSGPAPVCRIQHWPSYTGAPGNAFTNTAIQFAPVIWISVVNSGTTFTFNYAIDGQNFRSVFSESVTAYLTATPDQVGVGIFDNDSTVLTDALFVHWTGI